jgi:putative membrane protein
MAEDRTDLASDRTNMAEDRTVLAHERSFAGWVRTGMAGVGIGLAFNALFRSLDPTWVPKLIATSFLILSIFIFLSAQQRACRALERMESHRVAELRPIGIRLIAWLLSLATTALIAALWLLAAD